MDESTAEKLKPISLAYGRILVIPIILTSLFFANTVSAQYGVALGYGLNSNMFAYRLSLQVDSALCLDNDIMPTSGYWEGSANYIASKSNYRSSIEGLSLAYVFHFEKKDLYCIRNVPYAELGIGAGLFNKKRFLERNFGSSGLFEIKMGVGIRLGEFKQYDFSYKFIHYSNAFLKQPNEGLNLNFFVFSYLF